MRIIVPPLSGVDLGFSARTTRVRLLVGIRDPNAEATDNGNNDIASSAIGSLYLRSNGTRYYVAVRENRAECTGFSWSLDAKITCDPLFTLYVTMSDSRQG